MTTTDAPGSLVSRSNMGGIVGGDGYDFQTRYIVCHYPTWSRNPAFVEFFHEGTGDVDLRFKSDSETWREHIQIKDHNVPPSEFVAVVKVFHDTETGMPNVYRKFTLACPSVSPDVSSLSAMLSRLRGAGSFYSDKSEALDPTRKEIAAKIVEIGLDGYQDFIIDKVYIEANISDFGIDDRACNIFVGTILDHPEFRNEVRATVEPAYNSLLRQVVANRGTAVSAAKASEFIKRALRPLNVQQHAKFAVAVHNWTFDKLTPEPEYQVDWSAHFSRAEKKVPTAETWKAVLVPELAALKGKLQRERAERTIQFLGRPCLSAAILFGAFFPKAGGWNIEVQQPPSNQIWSSEVAADSSYAPVVDKVFDGKAGDEVAIAFDVTGRGAGAVTQFVQQAGLPVKALYTISPRMTPGTASIANAVEAISFAQSARDQLRAIRDSNAAKRTHVFYFGPAGVALFLGQYLTSVGEIQLYEFQDPSYAPSCSFRT